ncbi:Fur family transcriptional regulator [Embleya sp. NPDC008237]|uniref:Fur family transcriptional regulator n=1 Tax=Embleya sp. NPDC008237 TaxID=3363978 RepID=UPI0036F0FE49
MDDGVQHPTPDPVAEAVRQIRAHGERVTVARTAVLRVLADADEHLSADAIFAAVSRAAPGVHRTTIYRALDALERLDLVAFTRLRHDAATYHLAGHLVGGTHVLVRCRHCGTVGHAPGDLLDEVAARLAAEQGFTLDPTAVALTGRCDTCTKHPSTLTHARPNRPSTGRP